MKLEPTPPSYGDMVRNGITGSVGMYIAAEPGTIWLRVLVLTSELDGPRRNVGKIIRTAGWTKI